MKKRRWQVYFAFVLLVASAATYVVEYALFRDARHLFQFFFAKLAFLPVEVLLVTLVIHRLLKIWERRALAQKLNMVIGAFFGEVGTGLLERIAVLDASLEDVRPNLIITDAWRPRDFAAAVKRVRAFDFQIDPGANVEDLAELREFLRARRDFLLRLLENPNLLEHESFTDLLWAVTHLNEELASRGDLRRLTTADYGHLAGDIERAYRAVIREWLHYMAHLEAVYPYLFSLARRKNPFDPDAAIEVT